MAWLRGLVLFLVVICADGFDVRSALAHASLLEANPADGIVLSRSPEILTLRFNEPVSPTVFRIIDPTGVEITPPSVAALNETVTVKLGNPLPEGTSLLSYRIISADGHPVGGTISFSVGHPTNNMAPVSSMDRTVAAGIWLTRLLIYLGLFGGVGGVFFRNWIDPGAARRTGADTIIAIAMITAIPASAVALGLQGVDALGRSISAVTDIAVWKAGLSTTYAISLGFDVLAILIAGLARCAIPNPIAKALSLIGLCCVGLALAASGHASTIQPQWLSRGAVFVHGLGAAFWAGALVPLLDNVAGGRVALSRALHRFSAWAVPSVAIMAMAGIGLAVAQLSALNSLWLTAYGVVLMVKLILVLLLVGLASANRLWLTPSIDKGEPAATPRLRWSIWGELTLVVLILGIVALWRFTPPPRSMSEANAPPVHLHIHQLRAMLDLTLSPGKAGPVNVTMQFLSGDFGPLTPKEVTIALSKPESGIEAIEKTATLGPGEIWTAGPMSLPLAGSWHVRVDALISDFDKIILEDNVEIGGR